MLQTIGGSDWGENAQVHEMQVLETADVEIEVLHPDDLAEKVAARLADGWQVVHEEQFRFLGHPGLVVQFDRQVEESDLT